MDRVLPSKVSKSSLNSPRAAKDRPKHRAVTKACTTCRQSKIRCNAPEVFPVPCSNCQKLGKECRSDPAFKRTPIRGRLEEVTRQLDQIKNSQPRQETNPRQPISASSAGSQLAIPYSTHDNGIGSISYVSPPFRIDEGNETASQISSQKIEGYCLSGSDIAKLFENFVQNFLPHFPILETDMSVDFLHQSNPLLFWTIIFISSRHDNVLYVHYDNLTEPFKRLLSTYLVEPIRSLYTIQALLLYCLWPVPVRKQILDSSWNFCSLAVSAAIRMGLHQSDATWEYDFSQLSATDRQVRQRTWLGCFIVSTTLSSNLGLPSLIEPAMNCGESIGPCVSSDALTILFEIQRHVARFSTILSKRIGLVVRAPLIEMFSQDMNYLGDLVAKTRIPQLEINFLAARLNLYAFSILGETASSTSSRSTDPTVRSLWYLGLETAVHLSDLYSSMAHNTATYSPAPQPRHYPKHSLISLASSAFYLLKFLAVNTQATRAETELARSNIRLVFSTLQSLSNSEFDECARVTRILRLLANAELQGTLALFKRNDRVAATSIVADVMEIAAWLRATHVANTTGAAPDTGGTTVGIENANKATVSEKSYPPSDMEMNITIPDQDWIWEGLDDWLADQVNIGNLLEPYPEGNFENLV